MSVRIRLSPTTESVERFNRLFDNLETLPRRIVKSGLDPIVSLGHEAIDEIFWTERYGTWHELADFTQRERMRLGFPPAHPILFRTGKLQRSLTIKGGLNVVDVQFDGEANAVIRLGSSDYRTRLLHRGERENLPARPMSPVGPALVAFAKGAQDDVIYPIIDEAIRG